MKSFSKIWVVLGISMGGCDQARSPQPPLSSKDPLFPLEKWERKFEYTGQLFGDDFYLFGGKSPSEISQALWKGTLKSLSALPLDIRDMKQGLIQTKWFILERYPYDRFQIRVILAPTPTPKVEAIQVSVLHEICCKNQWRLGPVCPLLEYEIKRAILLNARACISQKAIH